MLGRAIAGRRTVQARIAWCRSDMCRDGLGRTPAAKGVPLFLYSVLVFIGLFECSRAEQSAQGPCTEPWELMGPEFSPGPVYKWPSSGSRSTWQEGRYCLYMRRAVTRADAAWADLHCFGIGLAIEMELQHVRSGGDGAAVAHCERVGRAEVLPIHIEFSMTGDIATYR